MYVDPVRYRERLEIRRRNGFRRLDWGSMELDFTEAEYNSIIAEYPELDQDDPELRQKEWKKFLSRSASEPYRLRERGLSRYG